MEWHPFFYKGHETNIEVNKLGEVRRLPKDWMKRNIKSKYPKVTNRKGYLSARVTIKNIGYKILQIHQIMGVVFLNHKICGMEKVIDHIDGNPSNNILENLQIVTQRQNCNKSIRKSKYGTGVHIVNKKYKNKIYISYQSIIYHKKYNYLGSFKTPEEASAAYQEALRKINAGEFVTN